MENAKLELSGLRELSRDLLQEGRKVRVTVTGTSMYPYLRDGDVVLIEPLTASPNSRVLKPGMVVCVELEDACMVHRIARVGPEGDVVTRSDFYGHRDPVRSGEKVLGIAVRRWRGGKSGRGRGIGRVPGWIISLARPMAYLLYRAGA